MKPLDEKHAVAQVIDRLAEKFPDIPRTMIEEIVHDEHEKLEGRPVRDYISVLVQHAAKDRLRILSPKKKKKHHSTID